MFLEDLKIMIMLVVLAILSALVRFKTFTQMCIDAILGFVMGYSVYLALDYFMLSGEARSGIAGIVIMISRPLYDFLNRIVMNKLEQWLDVRIGKHD